MFFVFCVLLGPSSRFSLLLFNPPASAAPRIPGTSCCHPPLPLRSLRCFLSPLLLSKRLLCQQTPQKAPRTSSVSSAPCSACSSCAPPTSNPPRGRRCWRRRRWPEGRARERRDSSSRRGRRTLGTGSPSSPGSEGRRPRRGCICPRRRRGHGWLS